MPSDHSTLPPPGDTTADLMSQLRETTRAIAGLGELLIETQHELRSTRAELSRVRGRQDNHEARIEELESWVEAAE